MQTNVVKRDTANLIYILNSNGIHEFIVKQSSRTAVDEIMSVFGELYDSTASDQILRRLFIMQPGVRLPSVAYTIGQTRQLLAKHKKPPKSRNALIYEDSVALSILRPSVRFLPFANAMPLGFFRTNEREQAITWLLDQPSAPRT